MGHMLTLLCVASEYIIIWFQACFYPQREEKLEYTNKEIHGLIEWLALEENTHSEPPPQKSSRSKILPF